MRPATKTPPSEPHLGYIERATETENGVSFTCGLGSKKLLPLSDFFDQVWVINLKRRPERLARFWTEIERAKWPFRQPQVFSAVEGDKVGVPKFWQTGGGSYGCLRSHLVILERAIQDDVGTILVMEDDVVFRPTFAEEVAAFLSKVPADWECLMIGGQHINSEPIPLAPGIVRAGSGGGIQRTHCYALRGQHPMKALYRTWANAAVHCDWVMGPCMAKFKTYAPHPFLAGQAEGKSDISGRENPAKFWRSPNGSEPVVVLRAPRPVMETLRKKGWHGGYTIDPATGIDVGLRDIFANANLTPDQLNVRLKEWIALIQAEVAAIEGRPICTVWHPKARASVIRPLIKGKVMTITATTVDEALEHLPVDFDNIDVKASDKVRVVILRAPRPVMENLRKQGWHTGYWRDEVSGQDNGVRKLFSARMDKRERQLELQVIARLLDEEVQELPGGIATLWHDEITADMLEAEDIRVIEITAKDADDAISKLNEATKCAILQKLP